MKPIRMAIDGNEANVTNRVGSNVYAFEILKGIAQLCQKKTDVEVTVLLTQSPLPDLPKNSPRWQYKVIGPKPLWTQWALPIHLFLHQHQYDIYFTPGHYAARISAIPYISTVMDTAYLDFPEQFRKNDYLQLKNWTAYSVKHAQKVIAISQATKQNIVQKYHKSKQEIVVAYPALQSSTYNISQKTRKQFFKKHHLGKNYILYLGTLQPRKNLIRLIEAFESTVRAQASFKTHHLKQKLLTKKHTSANQSDPLQLVLVGKVGWLAQDILDRVNASPYKDQIILTDYVTQHQKQILYESASVLVLVGLQEGFGMPPLEAMSYGVISVVSNNSSLPEVVGEAGIKVDPNQVSSIFEGLKKALTLTATAKAKYRREMRNQLKKFSWQHSSQIILDELLTVARAHQRTT